MHWMIELHQNEFSEGHAEGKWGVLLVVMIVARWLLSAVLLRYHTRKTYEDDFNAFAYIAGSSSPTLNCTADGEALTIDSKFNVITKSGCSRKILRFIIRSLWYCSWSEEGPEKLTSECPYQIQLLACQSTLIDWRFELITRAVVLPTTWSILLCSFNQKPGTELYIVQ